MQPLPYLVGIMQLVTWAPAAGGSSPGQRPSASHAPLSASPAPGRSAGSSCSEIRDRLSRRSSLLSITEAWGAAVLLLQLHDELFLAVQLVSQAADLLLVGISVGLDLLLHSFLKTWHSSMSTDTEPEADLLTEGHSTFTSWADWISFSFSMALTFSAGREVFMLVWISWFLSYIMYVHKILHTDYKHGVKIKTLQCLPCTNCPVHVDMHLFVLFK